MDENVTRPCNVGSVVSTPNGELDLSNWPLTAVATLTEANVRLALTLADRSRAALERLGQIGEKVLTECDAEGRIVLRRAFEPGRADIGDDVRPGQWDDVIADLQEWRLEVTDGFVAAWQDWQSAWAGCGIGDQPAQGRGDLILTPWPVAIAEPEETAGAHV